MSESKLVFPEVVGKSVAEVAVLDDPKVWERDHLEVSRRNATVDSSRHPANN